LHSRFRLAEVLQKILSADCKKAHDGGLVPSFQILNQFDNQVIARDLTEVCVTAEQWTGDAVNPLDPRFLRPSDMVI
jgi:hypothetical protein